MECTAQSSPTGYEMNSTKTKTTPYGTFGYRTNVQQFSLCSGRIEEGTLVFKHEA